MPTLRSLNGFTRSSSARILAGTAITVLLCPFLTVGEPLPTPGTNRTSLFDGKTLAGWEGDTKLWRVEGAALTGGSLTETVKQNEFLATRRDFSNFVVRLKIKLTGQEGFINSGFQIRSQRVPRNSEMSGYQCDFGDPNWWGAIYDESRRNKVLSPSDMAALGPVIKRQDWNEYVIRADGPRITTWINGVQGTDYVESDPNIPDWGRLGIQVHGGGKALVQVKEITIEELPPSPPGKIFRGAPEPKKNAKASPLSPEEEQAAFTLAPGFEIELVASESEGIGKFVTVDWDTQGRMWSMTALEYPVDANENPAVAKELYASKARDKVLVFDVIRDASSGSGTGVPPANRAAGVPPAAAAAGTASVRTTGGTPAPLRYGKPRVFAEGLAIPLGILPYKNGVYVQHGSDIVFLNDMDGDGRADKRDVILSGFGVQDSHLFPHQFTRAPGNWIWMAQGAFNYGKVRTTRGAEKQFDQTRMARFRYDGSDFDITSQGPCNIWGLVLNAEGECFIQEANDYGYPLMPFHEYANYPGCSGGQWKSYAPEFPGTAPDFQMGGTGLSGLALSDRAKGSRTGPPTSLTHHASRTGWPEAYADIMYIANPITRKIQAIKIHRDGPRYKLQKLPDFVLSSDEMFRPVSIRFGPDGCLYIVDWYNRIISHNEVPRNHADRDKKRGRIWRVKHREQKPFDVPDFTRLDGDELLARLGGDSLAQHHLAWQAIVDRQLNELAVKLKAIAANPLQSASRRIGALWALEGLNARQPSGAALGYFAELRPVLLGDANRNVRREAVRLMTAFPHPGAGASREWATCFDGLERAGDDSDPEVRAEVIKTTAHLMRLLLESSDSATAAMYQERALPLLVRMGRAPLDAPMGRSTHNGKPLKIGEAYEREFERYLVRMFLEERATFLAPWLDSAAAKSLPLENRLLATLALEPKASAPRVAQLLPQLSRAPGQEEVLRLAQFLDEPGVSDALKATLKNVATRTATLEALLKVQSRIDRTRLAALLTDTARELWNNKRGAAFADQKNDAGLALRLIGAFKLSALESDLIAVFEEENARRKAPEAERISPLKLQVMNALREINSPAADLFAKVYRVSAVVELREAAFGALIASKSERAPSLVLALWPDLALPQRRAALTGLSSTRSGASALMKSVTSGAVSKSDLDAATLDKLHTVLGESPELTALMSEMAARFRPVLRLDGKDNAWMDSDITLDGPFTVETWVKLDPGIDNNDGILGAPGVLDMNFFAGQFRVWVGGNIHDAIVAKKKMVPDVWTHIAVTRDAGGNFRIYTNGELDTDQGKSAPQRFEHLRVAWSAPAQGTAGWLTEYRVWNRARTADELRADFDRSFEDDAKPNGLGNYFTGANWRKLQPGAKVLKTPDFPPLLNPIEAKALAEKFTRFRALTERSGDAARGKALFANACLSCHSVGGQGGQVGPVLNGAGASGLEALLRNLLTPNAAMEAGYRVFRVELKDGDVIDGILVSQDKEAVVLRRPNVEDTRIAIRDLRRADFTNRSMMPEGLLDPLMPEEITDLFAYLKTLK